MSQKATNIDPSHLYRVSDIYIYMYTSEESIKGVSTREKSPRSASVAPEVVRGIVRSSKT